MSKIFNATFSSETIPSISFNEKWFNGTGYLDHASKGKFAPVVAPGEMVKSVTTEGRKIIIIGIPNAGNVVVFHRYTDNETCIVMNCPVIVSNLYTNSIGCGALDEASLLALFGDVEYPRISLNVGGRMLRYLNEMLIEA